jgi:hypothetical protein
VKGIPVTNAVAIPDWLQLATILNLCRTDAIFIHLKSMVNSRKFLGRADKRFLSARCNIHNITRSESRCALRLQV